MSNTIITPSVIASRALATLFNTIVLAGLVSRVYDTEFNGKQGDTITVRKPATFTVTEFDRNTGIVPQAITEDSFTVVLDTLLDISVPVTAEELTLELTSFDEQVLVPICNAFAQDIDGRLAEALVDAAEGGGGGGTTSSGASDATLPFRQGREYLTRNKLPLSQRYAVLSPESVTDCLGDDLFTAVDKSGSPDGLREASLGRVFGLDSFESQTFGRGAGDRGQADGVAFHREAVALTMVTLAAPMGLPPAQVSVKSFESLALRVTRDYDHDYKQDVVSVDALVGVKKVRVEGAVQLDFGNGS